MRVRVRVRVRDALKQRSSYLPIRPPALTGAAETERKREREREREREHRNTIQR